MIVANDGTPLHAWIVLRTAYLKDREWVIEASAATREKAETRARELAGTYPAHTWAIARVDEKIHVSVTVEFRRSAT